MGGRETNTAEQARRPVADLLGGLFLGAVLSTTFDALAPALHAFAFPAIVGLTAAALALGKSTRAHRFMIAAPFIAAIACALMAPGWPAIAALVSVAIAVGRGLSQPGRGLALGGVLGLGFGVFVWSARTTLGQQAVLLVVLGLGYAAISSATKMPLRRAPRPSAMARAIALGALLFACSAVFEASAGAFAPTWWACLALLILASSFMPRPSPTLASGAAILAALTMPTVFALPLFIVALAICARFLVQSLRPIEVLIGIALATFPALAATLLDVVVQPAIAFAAVVLVVRPKPSTVLAVGSLAIASAVFNPAVPLTQGPCAIDEGSFAVADSIYPIAPRVHIDARTPEAAQRLASSFPPTLTAALVLSAYSPTIATAARREGLYTLRVSSGAHDSLVFSPHPNALAHLGAEQVLPGPRPSPLEVWRCVFSVNLERR